MSKDVALFTKKCKKCQINKGRIKQIEPMTITTTPQKAFDIVCIDTIGPFPKTDQGNNYAVTIVCELTKYVIISPIPNKEARTVAKAILEDFILIYGPMQEIRTDMGTEYKNEIFKNLAEQLNIQHNMSTPYHSQSIGGCERNHRVFNEFIRMYINETKSDWDKWSKYFTFCYNTTPNTYHDYTPFELVFAKRAELPKLFDGTRVDPLYNIDAYDQEMRFRLQIAQNRAKQYLEKAKVARKLRYDKNATKIELVPGDSVIISNEDRLKLDPWYDGPFTVISTEGPNCTIENAKGKPLTVHKNRIRKFVE